MRVLSTPFFAKFDLPAPCPLEASIIFSVTKTSAEVSRRQNLHCTDTAMTIQIRACQKNATIQL